MMTPLRDGVIKPTLLKHEAAAVRKVLKLILPLTKMSPVDERLTAAANAATEGLRGVLDLAGEPEATE